MKLYVGTSGYAYKEWKGSFYPEDLPAKRMLQYYGERFGAVEINNTFYRMPSEAVVESWAAEVPEGFKFVIKAPQKITHFQRLKNTDEAVSTLIRVVGVLGAKLGPLLFQLPPNMKVDVERLSAFLQSLPRGCPRAIEFRHASWFSDEVFDLLREHQAALCLAEADDGVEAPFVSTADLGYLRLRRAEYGDAELKAWIKKVRQQDWREAFVFFKHEDEGMGPRFAERFLKLAGGKVSRRKAKKNT